MPGGDAREAAKTVTGSCEDFPFLPELPARGPGADMIGRTAGLLVELYARVEPSGWRIGDRPGRDTKRARSWLGEDLDALEEFTQGYAGPLKVQAVGPWTLAAALELRNGESALSDTGARRDLAGSLAEGLRLHLEEMRRRVPGAQLVLQLDEPSLTSVLRGHVKTASGYRTHRAVDRQVVEATLRDVIGVHSDGPAVVHSCAPDVPFALLRRAGATAISFDFSLLTERDDDTIGEAVEGGPGSSPVSCRGRTARCQTLPVASWVSGRCGAGWGCNRGFSRRRSRSRRRADSRGPPRITHAGRSPTASGRRDPSRTTQSNGRTQRWPATSKRRRRCPPRHGRSTPSSLSRSRSTASGTT